MNLLGLLLFGIIFSFVLFGYVKPDVVFPGATYIYLKGGRIPASKRTVYFVFLLSAVVVFLIIAGFQYINTAEFTRDAFGGWPNDMSRYWFGFQDAGKQSLGQFMLSQMQEPLYLIFIYVMRRLTSHFSLVLLVAYGFYAVSVIKFLRDFVLFGGGEPRQPFAFAAFAFFCMLYTFILVSFCLFRTGLSVAIALHVYKFLLKEKWKGAYIASLAACGFHFSAAILFPICIMYRIWRSKKLRLNFFLFIFFIVFVLGLAFARLVPQLMKMFVGRYAMYVSGGGIAVNTYLTDFLLVLMILYRRKDFFRTKQDDICFIMLLSSFFVLDLQLIMNVFLRMLYFIYPSIILLIPRLFKIYKVRKNDMIVPLLARLFLVVYLVFFLYQFCKTPWKLYGLTCYRLFYFN